MLRELARIKLTLKNDICTSVDAKIDTLTTSLRAEITLARKEIHGDIAAVRGEAGALANRVTELETGTNHWADVTTSLENMLQILTKQVTSLTEKCEGLEGRNNLRIIGLSEGIEGTCPTDFIANLLKDVLQLQQRPKPGDTTGKNVCFSRTTRRRWPRRDQQLTRSRNCFGTAQR